MPTEIDFNEEFNDSYEFIRNRKTEFYDLFYEKFFNSSPSIKKTFENTDMNVQKMVLEKAIVYMINFFVTKKANDFLIETAKRHMALNINNEMYDLFMESLLLTLSEIYPRFSNKCAIAWRITMSPGFEFMKHYGDIEPK